MTLDIAMGGSTNTVLHLLAAAHEGEVDFTMADIDRLSRRVPVLCKVAPSVPDVHVEDVHRAGGIMGILGELDRAGLLNRERPMVHAETLGTRCSATTSSARPAPRRANSSARRPAACRRRSRSARPRATNRSTRTARGGVIRDLEHAFSQDGGLAVLYGNLAEDGCIVKTAGVDAGTSMFAGPVKIFESQDDAVPGILGGKVVAGDVVVIRYEGPRGGPGMQEMLYPTSYLKSKGLGKALRADHRRPLFRRHVGPVDRPCLAGSRRGRRDRPGRGGRPDRDRHPRAHRSSCWSPTRRWRTAAPPCSARARPHGSPPQPRKRNVTTALRAYAALTTSAARGAVREVP